MQNGDGKYAGTNPKSIGNGVKMSECMITDYSDGTITLTKVVNTSGVEVIVSSLWVIQKAEIWNLLVKYVWDSHSSYYITNTEGQYVFAYL